MTGCCRGLSAQDCIRLHPHGCQYDVGETPVVEPVTVAPTPSSDITKAAEELADAVLKAAGELHQPETATKQRVNVHSQHEANPPGQATVQNECVTIVGSERGTVANSKPMLSAIESALYLRPNCQKPGREDCGGYGRVHCHTCNLNAAAMEDA